jgi:anti-sigma B factor antagonist
MHQSTLPAPTPFRCHATREGTRVTIVVEGELDIATAAELREEVRDAYAAVIEALELDLRPLTFIDAGGVRLLLEARAEADANGVVLVVRLGPASRRILDLVSVSDQLAS